MKPMFIVFETKFFKMVPFIMFVNKQIPNIWTGWWVSVCCAGDCVHTGSEEVRRWMQTKKSS